MGWGRATPSGALSPNLISISMFVWEGGEREMEYHLPHYRKPQLLVYLLHKPWKEVSWQPTSGPRMGWGASQPHTAPGRKAVRQKSKSAMTSTTAEGAQWLRRLIILDLPWWRPTDSEDPCHQSQETVQTSKYQCFIQSNSAIFKTNALFRYFAMHLAAGFAGFLAHYWFFFCVLCLPFSLFFIFLHSVDAWLSVSCRKYGKLVQLCDGTLIISLQINWA
jgi:hypothetical protein